MREMCSIAAAYADGSLAGSGLALVSANPEVRQMGRRRGVAVTAGVTGMDRAVRSLVKRAIRFRDV